MAGFWSEYLAALRQTHWTNMLLPLYAVGTALFLGAWLKTGQLQAALERSVAAMYALVDVTHRAGSRELELIAAQDQLVDPPRKFPAVQLG